MYKHLTGEGLYNKIKINVVDLDFDSIIEELYKIKKEDPKGIIRSNVKGYHTDFILGNLRDTLYAGLFHVLKDNPLNKVLDKDHVSFWGMINSPGSSNKLHSHIKGNKAFIPPTMQNIRDGFGTFSGVFYLQVPENSGNLVFVDRDGQEYVCEPKVGKLVTFPGSLKHYVEENKSNRDRISISFNITKKRGWNGIQAK